MKPGGTPGLKDVNLDELDLSPLNGRPNERSANNSCPWHICQSRLYCLYCYGRQSYRWMVIVLTCNCPLSPKVTSSKRSRIRCSLSLIATFIQNALNFFTALFSMYVAPKLVQISSKNQCSVAWVAWLVRLNPCPLSRTKIGALPVAPLQNCSLPAVPW